jgi:hypothetical protein
MFCVCLPQGRPPINGLSMRHKVTSLFCRTDCGALCGRFASMLLCHISGTFSKAHDTRSCAFDGTELPRLHICGPPDIALLIKRRYKKHWLAPAVGEIDITCCKIAIADSLYLLVPRELKVTPASELVYPASLVPRDRCTI